VEERAREILGTLARLRGDFEKLQENFRVLGKHLVNAQGGYADTEKTLTKVRREAGSDFRFT
jgi:DNA anti-recombination protein RmuC